MSRYSTMDTQVSLVIFALASFLTIETVTAVTVATDYEGPQLDVLQSRYCDFVRSQKLYNITDLLRCMNELAVNAATRSRFARSSDTLVASRRAQNSYLSYLQPQYNYSPRPGVDHQSYFDRRPNPYYPGSGAPQGDNAGYYEGGTRYPYSTPETPFSFPGGSGAGLFDALTSISQYDDLKCVPRLLCEVATGVTPGNSGYKQSYDDFGGNSLIRLLTSLDFGGSSPLLAFGKSALTGYTSRGNPGVCYREYPKCPRNNADLVNYLNNHNGGFFRFFGNNRGQGSQRPQGNYYRGVPTREPGLYSGREADRTGTGEIKFDSSASLVRRDFAKTFFPEQGELNAERKSNNVVFPQEPLQEEQSLNRVSKSLRGYQEAGSGYQNPSFFPQDRKDQEVNMLFGSSMRIQGPPRTRSSWTMEAPKARLYLPDDPSNETTSTFTFPDGQKVQVNVAFSKLFSEGYKKALRRSFANDHGPQPVNYEGFSMVNLAELYPNDRNRLDRQVVHPCDMICHDSKGTPVQFNQILLHSGNLSTLMAPDQPVLDLSNPLPCEVMCIDRRGERRRLSTSLNRVLRAGNDQPDFMGLQDNLENQEYQWLNPRIRRTKLRNREVKVNRRMSPRETDKTENNLNTNDKAASMPEGSIIFGGGPMPFFGPPMPFMGLGEFSEGGPAFPQGAPGPFGLTMPSMQGLPMPPDAGIMQTLGMMPMFPRMMPMMDPLSAGFPAMMPVPLNPAIVCSAPGCPSRSQSSTRALMMCGSVLYFIPYEIFVLTPVCAVGLDTSPTAQTGSPNQSDSPSHSGSPSQSGSPSHSGSPSQSDRPSLSGSPSQPDRPSHSGSPNQPDNPSHSGSPSQSDSPSYSGSPSNSGSRDETQQSVPPIAALKELGEPGEPGSMSQVTKEFRNHTGTVSTEATTHKFRQPEGDDYPQLSCLEGESWNLDVHECVPIKYDKDVESDYTHLPGSPWSGVTRRPIKTHRQKKRKKLVLITDKGNITYIKAA